MTDKKANGDYQTPLKFSDLVCELLLKKWKIQPKVVVEPTCGKGNFLESSLVFKATKYIGVEKNRYYFEYTKDRLASENMELYCSDIFKFSLKDKSGSDGVLLIGNPPWVTSSTLSSLDKEENFPNKENIKGLSGLDALTGASNFDICEYIILQFLEEFQQTDTTIAMLCKTSVARNIFQEIHRRYINFRFFEIVEFDSKKVFNISASACLMIIQLTHEPVLPKEANSYYLDGKNLIEKGKFGYRGKNFYSDLNVVNYDFDGDSEFEWRQGVKHDNSKVMELNKVENTLVNKFGEIVDIEKDLVYPLIKSSMVKKSIITDSKKYVIVTQKKVGEDTKYIEQAFPKTWRYLQGHLESFRSRKSSIYLSAPDFAMFGVGDYSYSPYKVGVSGFYKKPIFSLFYTNEKKPIMMDDTGYFLSFENYDIAYVAMLLLNSVPVQKFLLSISFLDSKRPYTKKVLKRLEFSKMVSKITIDELKETEKNLGLKEYVCKELYNIFKNSLIKKEILLFD